MVFYFAFVVISNSFFVFPGFVSRFANAFFRCDRFCPWLSDIIVREASDQAPIVFLLFICMFASLRLSPLSWVFLSSRLVFLLEA
jgi:hypothetical protein